MPNFDMELGPPVKEEAQSGNQVFATPNGSHGFGLFRSLVSTDIPALDFSKITTGIVPIAQGGTGVTLAGTGGASQVLKQVSSGANITVGQLAFTDISGTAVKAQIPTTLASTTFDNTITLSAGGITFNANPGGGTQDTINDYETMTYSAVDASGAGLTLTTNASSVRKLGKYVFFSLDVSYPTTANGSSAKIALPYSGNAATNSLFITNCVGAAGGISVIGVTVSGNIVFWQVNNDSQLNNSVFSNARVFLSGVYLTTT